MNILKTNLSELKRYFTFNRTERRGSVIIIVLILVSWMGYFVLSAITTHRQSDFEKFKNEIASFEKSLVADSLSIRVESHKEFDFNNPDQSIAREKLNPFQFNPNHLSAEKWEELGLSEKQIEVILNYEAKGGKFYKKEDFRKMYCISETEYEILEPFIVIPEPQKDSSYKKTAYVGKKAVVVELNAADTLELQLLRGIGSSFAGRIVKYREKLGGFYCKEQLLEVWGMDTARYHKLAENVVVDKSLIRKININKANVKELMKHPYIEYPLALSIVKYRAKNGNFSSVQQINSASAIYKELFLKIEPYLTVE